MISKRQALEALKYIERYFNKDDSLDGCLIAGCLKDIYAYIVTSDNENLLDEDKKEKC